MTNTEAVETTRTHYYVETRPETGGPWVRYGASPRQQTPDGPYGGIATVNERRAFALMDQVIAMQPTDMLVRVTSSGGYRGCTRNGTRTEV